MPLTEDTFYCHEQIKVPPDLPDILKQFTKAAIRTQPRDVIKWSAAYFEALTKKEPPPVSKRLNMPVATQKTDTGLTLNLLINLHRQIGHMKRVKLDSIETKWRVLDIPMELFNEMVKRGGFASSCDWNEFLTVCCQYLAESMTKTMRMLSEILTSDPEGGAAGISNKLWFELYEFLCVLNGEISQVHREMVKAYLTEEASLQEGIIYPRNFEHKDCPKLNPKEF
ncbi:Ropporin-1-like protein [Cichlidogyrus casuarinus]|uniref:Ropporin-1-like protein n=1 Tax=Cichlidogyrus casuarinus TaxID=1844966 RepID=A0ABD2PVV3_9PLAT